MSRTNTYTNDLLEDIADTLRRIEALMEKDLQSRAFMADALTEQILGEDKGEPN